MHLPGALPSSEPSSQGWACWGNGGHFDQGAVGWRDKAGRLMPSVREGLLGEVAFERRGRVGPRGSGEVPAQARAGHSHRSQELVYFRAGSPQRVWSRQDVCVHLPAQGRVETGRPDSGWTGLTSHPSSCPPPKVPSWAMDMNVLMSAQLLMESRWQPRSSEHTVPALPAFALQLSPLDPPATPAVRLGRCADLGEDAVQPGWQWSVLRGYSPVADLRG